MFELFVVADVSVSWSDWIVSNWDRQGFSEKLGIIAGVVALLFWVLRIHLLLKRRIAGKIADPEQLWKKRASQLQEDIYQGRVKKGSIPILTVANFKGGSGKTMLAANLAAYFDLIGAKVLLIDFDAHGSLSDLVGYQNKNMTGKSSFLLERQKPLKKIWPNKISELSPGRGFQNTYIYDAGKELTRSENALLLEWIAGQKIRSSADKLGMRHRFFAWFNFRKRIVNSLWRWWHRGQLDLRFNTFNYLKEKDIQENFDLIIIDTPSQLTPAFVNALCASTHLLLPATADKVSVETTIQSTDVFQKLRSALRLDFRTLSIIPTMIQENGKFMPREEKSLKKLARDMNSTLRKSIIEGDIQRMPRGLRSGYRKDLPSMDQDYKGVIWEDRRVLSKRGILDDEGNLTFHHQQPATNSIFRDMFGRLGKWLIEEFEGEKGGVLSGKLDSYNEQQAKLDSQPSGKVNSVGLAGNSANQTTQVDKTG